MGCFTLQALLVSIESILIYFGTKIKRTEEMRPRCELRDFVSQQKATKQKNMVLRS